MQRPFRILLAAAMTLAPVVLGPIMLALMRASAQDAVTGNERPNAGQERREEPIRIQVGINLFFPGPAGDSEEATKVRDRARRSVYEMAARECGMVEQVLAKTCRLESVNVNININRQFSAQQTEGYAAVGNFVLRVTLK
jgi:hypothetical protein